MERTKYGRTFHLPWSPGATSDDKTHTSAQDLFEGREVVVLEKMDGENCSIYADGYCHARSVDSKNHESRKWVQKLAERVGHQGLPPNVRVCGENLFAKHSIHYTQLESFFLCFGVWEGSTALSWDDVVYWCALLDLSTVPVLYRGPWESSKVKACGSGFSTASPGDIKEGYVVRLASSFTDFENSVAKFVRANHVQSSEHWMRQAVIPNQLRKD